MWALSLSKYSYVRHFRKVAPEWPLGADPLPLNDIIWKKNGESSLLLTVSDFTWFLTSSSADSSSPTHFKCSNLKHGSAFSHLGDPIMSIHSRRANRTGGAVDRFGTVDRLQVKWILLTLYSLYSSAYQPIIRFDILWNVRQLIWPLRTFERNAFYYR